MAKATPASLTPRRFTAVSRVTNSSASSTRWGPMLGKAEMMLSTPEETDTATVMT